MVKLKRIGDYLSFDNENELEHFVWENLEELFGFTPLERQHYIDDRRCDILATTQEKELVIIELKNSECKDVIQQINRYLHLVLQEKPFEDKIDYSKEPCLIVIAHYFHPSALSERRASKLSVDFFKFEILPGKFMPTWKLETLDGKQICEIDILDQELPSVPRKLLSFLSKNSDEVLTERILNTRARILRHSEQMRERVYNSGVLYTTLRTNYSCAEFKIDGRNQKLALFLHLPHPTNTTTTRMIIHTEDWLLVDRLEVCPKGFRTSIFEQDYWPTPKFLVLALNGWERHNIYARNAYRRLLEKPKKANHLSLLIDVALDEWSDRVKPSGSNCFNRRFA